jgi:tetratricopeptide (TPR) repeat protein
MAHTHLSMNNYREAIASLENAIALDPDNPDIRSLMARVLLEVGDIEGCKTHLERALEITPNSAKALHVRGLLHRAEGNDDVAVLWFRKALWADGSCSPAYLDLAKTYVEQRKLEQARQALEHGLGACGEHPGLLVALADTCTATGNLEQALQYIGRALAVKSDDAEAWIKKGDLHRFLKSYREASAAYEKAVAVDPENTRAWVRTAQIMLITNDRETALECLNTACTLAPNDADVAHERGLVLLSLGRLKEALADFDAAFSVSPARPINLYYRAQILERMGRRDEAIRTWSVAHDLYEEAGDRAKAAETLARMKRLQSETPSTAK